MNVCARMYAHVHVQKVCAQVYACMYADIFVHVYLCMCTYLQLSEFSWDLETGSQNRMHWGFLVVQESISLQYQTPSWERFADSPPRVIRRHSLTQARSLEGVMAQSKTQLSALGRPPGRDLSTLAHA